MYYVPTIALMSTFSKVCFLSVRALAWFLGATMAGLLSGMAATPLPGDLAAAASGNDLVLSFQATAANYYGVQMCPDLSHPWTNVQAGLQGFGLVKTVTLSNALVGSQGF